MGDVIALQKQHLWPHGGVVHACEGACLYDDDPDTYVVWTLCGIDCPPNSTFKGRGVVTCPKCLAAMAGV